MLNDVLGQAGALRLGLARALSIHLPDQRPILKTGMSLCMYVSM